MWASIGRVTGGGALFALFGLHVQPEGLGA